MVKCVCGMWLVKTMVRAPATEQHLLATSLGAAGQPASEARPHQSVHGSGRRKKKKLGPTAPKSEENSGRPPGALLLLPCWKLLRRCTGHIAPTTEEHTSSWLEKGAQLLARPVLAVGLSGACPAQENSEIDSPNHLCGLGPSASFQQRPLKIAAAPDHTHNHKRQTRCTCQTSFLLLLSTSH